jgi:DNA-binding ferritin-like protein
MTTIPVSYEFASALYRNSREMHDAIAEDYMSAGGANDRETMREFFAKTTNEQLAGGAEEDWELLENDNYDRAQLVAALEDLRVNLDERFPE